MNIQLTKSGLSIVWRALNNACGYPMSETIEQEIGFTRIEMNELHHLLHEDPSHFLTITEIEMIRNSLRVCIKYIDAWEFPATFDHNKEEVIKFYQEFANDK